MKPKMVLVIIVLSMSLWSAGSLAIAGNIDPDADGHKYAWGENIGWIDFEPAEGIGVTVTDTDVTGDAWSENTGWIVLDPSDGGVLIDGYGNLSGCAWGENIGWISFSCETVSCGTVDYGVSIDPYSGEFSGKAWGENVGWISFDYDSSDSHGVKTSWQTCEGDLDVDGDVDGYDLFMYAGGSDFSDLPDFANLFGEDDCFE